MVTHSSSSAVAVLKSHNESQAGGKKKRSGHWNVGTTLGSKPCLKKTVALPVSLLFHLVLSVSLLTESPSSSWLEISVNYTRRTMEMRVEVSPGQPVHSVSTLTVNKVSTRHMHRYKNSNTCILERHSVRLWKGLKRLRTESLNKFSEDNNQLWDIRTEFFLIN
jgi:hypothetical protein